LLDDKAMLKQYRNTINLRARIDELSAGTAVTGAGGSRDIARNFRMDSMASSSGNAIDSLVLSGEMIGLVDVESIKNRISMAAVSSFNGLFMIK